MAGARFLFIVNELLDEDVRNAYLISSCRREDDFSGILGLTTLRQFHSKPTMYSEHWVTEYIDEDFKAHFRLSREKFDYVLHSCLMNRVHSSKSWSIDPRKAFEITLWYLATQVSWI